MSRFNYEIRDGKQYVRDDDLGDLLGPFGSALEARRAIEVRKKKEDERDLRNSNVSK